MSAMKSRFVGLYMLMVIGLPIYAVVRLAQDGFDFGFMGALMTTVPMALMLSFAMISSHLARTSSRLPEFILLGLMGLVLAVYGYTSGASGLEGLVWSIVGFVGFLIYDFWYSSFDRQPSVTLSVGNRLPDFGLEDEDGQVIKSSDFRGGPAIFLFFRGNWCPLCMAQIKEIADQYQQLTELGARVALISPQSHDHTRKLAARFSVPFDFLVDVENKVAEQLGIAHKDGLPLGMTPLGYDTDTVMPTLLVVDADGKILFSDQTDNYRVRPEPETFLNILRQA
ncbi:MAG: peroxiredoxin family protein [Alphaproteobacteria bacterium]